MKLRMTAMLPLLLVLLPAMVVAQPLQVAIYDGGLGGKAIAESLADQPEFEAAVIKDLTVDELIGYDALFIGSTRFDQPDALRAIRIFVGLGGGVMLNHAAAGRYLPQTPFPAVATTVSGRREDTIVLPAAEHPVAQGLPAEFEHAYYDHLMLEPGAAGTVVIRDRSEAAVAIAGEEGEGRVILCGMAPGYFFDAATFAQGERVPVDGELQFVLSSLRWLGEKRLSQTPPAQIADARRGLEQDLALEELQAAMPTSDWFGGEMLHGSYLPRQPVNELGGRFFITYDSQTWRGYDMRKARSEEELAFFRTRLMSDVMRLKWLGVTDIMWWTDMSGDRVFHNTDVPDSAIQYGGFDPLKMLCEVADEAGMNVWAAWHSMARGEEFAQKYCAKDADGNLYMYGGRSYAEDVLSPLWRGRVHAMIDEYAERYGAHESFKGVGCYDELWFTYCDFLGDDLDAFDAFSRERFGEALPADIGEKLALQREWTDTEDVWRRRYILFKQWTITDYLNDVIDYCHSKDMEFGLEILATAHYSSGWCWGMDSVELARLGADYLICSPGLTAVAFYPNSVRWAHAHDGWDIYNTHCFRPSIGGTYFTFNQLWRPVMYGNNPDVAHQAARHIQNQREWAGGESLARAAVLHHQNALQMLLEDPRPETNREQAVIKAVQSHQPCEYIFTRATETHGRYRLLIAGPYSVRGLSEEVMADLRGFIEGGGTMLSLNADWSASRADLTDERDATAEIVGVRYGDALPEAPCSFAAEDLRVTLPAATARRAVEVLEGTEVLIAFEDGTPAVTRRALGQGSVVGVHFGLMTELEKGETPELAQWLSMQVAQLSQPEVYCEGTGFRVMGAQRKGDWIGVALFPEEVPSVAKMHVNLPALGINREEYRMLHLGKEMEIQLPGDRWGDDGFWTPQILADGFDVTICSDHDRNMPMPDELDLSEFDEDAATYIKSLTDRNWDSVTEGQEKRTYSHEIVVLAPATEMVMPQE
jgi:hypothetical protein